MLLFLWYLVVVVQKHQLSANTKPGCKIIFLLEPDRFTVVQILSADIRYLQRDRHRRLQHPIYDCYSYSQSFWHNHQITNRILKS